MLLTIGKSSVCLNFYQGCLHKTICITSFFLNWKLNEKIILLHSYQGHIQLFRDRDSEEKSEGAPSLAHNNHLPTLTWLYNKIIHFLPANQIVIAEITIHLNEYIISFMYIYFCACLVRKLNGTTPNSMHHNWQGCFLTPIVFLRVIALYFQSAKCIPVTSPNKVDFVTLYSYPTIPSGSGSRFNHGPPVYIRVIHLTTV